MIKACFKAGTDDIKDAFNVRQKVFVEEQNIDKSIEFDEFDKTSDHLIVYEDDKVVGTSRLVINDKEYVIGRIAVLKEYRGQKIGDMMVRVLVRRAFDLGAKEVIAHVQINAKEFYEKLGFESYGDEFYEAGIKHINMKKTSDFESCSGCKGCSGCN